MADLPAHPEDSPATQQRRSPVLADVYDLVSPDDQLDPDEATYVAAARAQNTVRGCRSDWKEWCTWTSHHQFRELPASPT